MSSSQGHLRFFALFTLTITIFLFPLIFLGMSFLYGDNFVQFYPWLKIYAENIKQFRLPFWVSGMQCGFPLVAEGQTGAFYPLNLLIFFLLPFNLAYNFSIILHFVLGGVMAYFFCRALKGSQAGGYLVSLLFCFGSAFAGCFYNIVSLRTLAWVPGVFLCLEYFFLRTGRRYIFFAGILTAMQLLAGFVQMAAYSILFYALYFFYRAKTARLGVKRTLLSFAIFLATAFSLSCPQLLLTAQLAKLSSRGTASLGFALWNSFNPAGALGLVFPYALQRIGGGFYVGLLSLFFVIYAWLNRQENYFIRPLLLLLFFSLFCALGQFNPFFVLALKLCRFYAFRNPSKFLFFSAFFLALLAGIGFSLFSEENKFYRRAIKYFRGALLFCSASFAVFAVSLAVFKEQYLKFGGWVVRAFVAGKPYHRYSLESYLQRVEEIYLSLRQHFSLTAPYNLWAWLLVALFFFAAKRLLRRKNQALLLFLIFADIFIFSLFGVGFRGNLRRFSYLAPDYRGLFSRIKSDKEVFRIYPYNFTAGGYPNWAVPNANLSYGLESIAAYAPLASRHYRQQLQELEIVDDSLGVRAPEKEAIAKHREILRLLNVKYIISPLRLDYDFLQEVASQGKIRAYLLKGYLPRLFLSPGLERPSVSEGGSVRLLEYRGGSLKAVVETDEPAYLIFSEACYPAWRVYLDSKEGQLLEVQGLIQAVRLNKGRQVVEFKFRL